MYIKKLIRFIHRWLGLISGLVIFIVAITGAAYVFYEEITNITDKSFRFVEPQSRQKIPASQIKEIAIAEVAKLAGKDKPVQWDWESIYYYNQPNRSIQYACRHYKEPDVLYQVYLNPYNGTILKSRTGDGKFWEIVIGLHTSLLLGDTGTYIVEFSTLIFLIMIISGIVLWWPKNKAAAKQRFSVKLNASPKRLNYDLHNVLGFYMCWGIIFTVLTGLVWSFNWASKTMFFLADGKQPTEQKISLTDTIQPFSNSATLDIVVAKINKLYPSAYNVDVGFPKEKQDPYNVRVWTTNSNHYHIDNLVFNPYTSQLLKQEKFANKSTGQKLNDMTSDIHYGWIFGLPSKIAIFFCCLIAASLPITGFYIWWGRKSKSKKSNEENSKEILKNYFASKQKNKQSSGS